LIRLEAEAIGVPAYMQAIEFPNPDFVAFARACGGSGFAANLPHLDLEQIGHVALARVREAVLAVTGS
jgi:thiamine pyrophosphate-dependent acetolactate synthase large subunit-like protein